MDIVVMKVAVVLMLIGGVLGVWVFIRAPSDPGEFWVGKVMLAVLSFAVGALFMALAIVIICLVALGLFWVVMT